MEPNIPFDRPVNSYIFGSMQDGVLLLDDRGRASYMNPAAADILGREEADGSGIFLAGRLLQGDGRNDPFHQFLLDAVYDKSRPHEGLVGYLTPSGEEKTLEVKSSFWTGSEEEEGSGIVLLLRDVTRRERLRREKKDAITLLSMLIALVCGWVIFVEALEFFHLAVPSFLLTYLLMALGFVLLLLLRKKTDLSFGDMGLSVRGIGSALVVDSLITLAALGLMVAAKALILWLDIPFFPQGQPFWYFRVTSTGMLLYPLSVIMQEFISRGVLHESLRKILQGRHREFYAILLSSLMFSALHVERGFLFMLGAMLLLSTMGVLYLRQRTIWGLCIPHYVLTMAAIFLGFL